MRWVLAMLAVLALGACSEDDATTDTTTTETTTSVSTGRVTSATTSVPATTTGPAGTSAVPTTVAPPTAAVTGATTSPAATGEWCLRAAELNQLAGAFRELDATDRDAVEMALGEILDRLERIEVVVPGQLETDLAISAEAFRLLDAALAAVDYDMAAADFSELDERRAAIVAANARIREYNHDECGLDAGVTGAEVP